MGFPKIFHKECAPLSGVPQKPELQKKTGTPHRILSFLKATKSKSKPKPLPSQQVKRVLGGRYLSPNATESLDNSTDSASSTAKTASWKSCASPEYKRYEKESVEDPAELWNRALQDSRRLPQSTKFSNNHIMVNTERAKRCAPALKRIRELDALARWHAESMALKNAVFHADESELLSRLERPTDFLGENVARGESIRSIHQEMVKNKSDILNMANIRYKEMGMATARGPDGDLFLCQIFRQ